jgi:hypothetical protein
MASGWSPAGAKSDTTLNSGTGWRVPVGRDKNCPLLPAGEVIGELIHRPLKIVQIAVIGHD